MDRKSVKLFNRQKFLLQFLVALGGKAAKTDFQKLLFLYVDENQQENLYDFVPYNSGAFSYTSCADCRKLTDLGLIQEEENHWQISQSGSSLVGCDINLWLKSFLERHHERGDDLTRRTYLSHPYYAIHSTIADRVLSGLPKMLQKLSAMVDTTPQSTLYTIGYEGFSIESYVNKLIKAGIKTLVDVRSNPISRKYGFSKKTLACITSKMRIVYHHIPELGVTSVHRQTLDSQEDYDKLFETYRFEWLPEQSMAVSKLLSIIEKTPSAALTCYEADPIQCHRTHLAGQLKEQLPEGYKIKHLCLERS